MCKRTLVINAPEMLQSQKIPWENEAKALVLFVGFDFRGKRVYIGWKNEALNQESAS